MIVDLGIAAIPTLMEFTRSDSVDIRWWAGTALVKIGPPSVTNLLEVMSEANVNIRILALRSLVEIRDHRAIPVVMKSMSEGSALLQYWAKVGLERLGLDMVYIKP